MNVRVSLCVYAFHSFICFVKCYICCFDFFFVFLFSCVFLLFHLQFQFQFSCMEFQSCQFLYILISTRCILQFCFVFILYCIVSTMLGKEKETIYLVLFSLSMCVFALCVCRCATLPSHKNVHSFLLLIVFTLMVSCFVCVSFCQNRNRKERERKEQRSVCFVVISDQCCSNGKETMHRYFYIHFGLR